MIRIKNCTEYKAEKEDSTVKENKKESLKLILDPADEILTEVHPYGGYVGEPLFKEPEESTYFDPIADSQCRIPLHKDDYSFDEDEEEQKK